jgi:hypothetical protein
MNGWLNIRGMPQDEAPTQKAPLFSGAFWLLRRNILKEILHTIHQRFFTT